jgi:hypothetical protein
MGGMSNELHTMKIFNNNFELSPATKYYGYIRGVSKPLLSMLTKFLLVLVHYCENAAIIHLLRSPFVAGDDRDKRCHHLLLFADFGN